MGVGCLALGTRHMLISDTQRQSLRSSSYVPYEGGNYVTLTTQTLENINAG
jgi:hypothetical protein